MSMAKEYVEAVEDIYESWKTVVRPAALPGLEMVALGNSQEAELEIVEMS